jgi:hypothetical protein
MEQAADLVHALAASPDNPPLTAVEAPHGVGRGSFLGRFWRVERSYAGRDDGQDAKRGIQIEQSPSNRRDATIDTDNSHYLPPGRQTALDRALSLHEKSVREIGRKATAKWSLSLKDNPRICSQVRGDS